MKNAIKLTTIIFIFLSANLSAEPSSQVAFDNVTRAMIASGDVATGKELTAKYKCNKCHGENGISDDEDPNTAGQGAAYNFKQMMDYKSGDRDERTMAKKIKKVSPQEMAHIAAWYASLPRPAAAGKSTKEIEKLVYKGDPKRSLKPCGSCHSRDGLGGDNDADALIGENS
jgi:cytochrome c553